MTLEGLIIFLLVGLIAGWLAARVMQRGFGLIGNLIIGVLGAVIGGYLFSLLSLNIGGSSILGSIFVAFVGATIVLIFVQSLVRKMIGYPGKHPPLSNSGSDSITNREKQKKEPRQRASPSFRSDRRDDVPSEKQEEEEHLRKLIRHPPLTQAQRAKGVIWVTRAGAPPHRNRGFGDRD